MTTMHEFWDRWFGSLTRRTPTGGRRIGLCRTDAMMGGGE